MNVRQHLLEKAMRRWEIDRRLAEAMEKDEARGKAPRPLIAISRELGSGGASIGKILANRLRFRYFDRQLLEEIAAAAGSDAEHVRLHEEGGPRGFANMLLSALDRRHLSETAYLRALIRVLKTIAKEGRAIIIGRGAACVLPEALCVRFVAPFELRVHRMAELRNLSLDEARRLVLENDYQQRRFLRDFFGCQPDDPYLYDLVINTAQLSLEHGAELVLMRLRQTWPQIEEA